MTTGEKGGYIVKKLYIILPVVAAVCGVLLFLSVHNYGFRPDQFELDNYRAEIEQFPSDEVMGKIENIDDAVKKAKVLFEKNYENEHALFFYAVYFDKNENAWMVRRSIPKLFSTFGGGADVIFNGDDGKVVAMWGNK